MIVARLLFPNQRINFRREATPAAEDVFSHDVGGYGCRIGEGVASVGYFRAAGEHELIRGIVKVSKAYKSVVLWRMEVLRIFVLVVLKAP